MPRVCVVCSAYIAWQADCSVCAGVTTRKNRDLEGPIHRAIIAYLRAKGIFAYHPANEIAVKGPAIGRAIAKNKWNGTTPGFPDVLCFYKGRAFVFEVKAKGGYLTPAQKAVRDQIEAQGIPFAVVRSIDDVKEAMEEWRVE